MSSRAAGVIVAVGAALILTVFVARGATLLPCIDRPSDPLCVSLVFTRDFTIIPPGPSASNGAPAASGPLGSSQQAPGDPVPTDQVAYTFRDEFNGTALGRAWGNHWGTAKPGRWSASQARVTNGTLRLTAEITGS